MSPVSKSKSKDKKAVKEPQKASLKTPAPAPANAASVVPASAYNPLSGTFHTLETVPTSSASTLTNGRFRNIDDTDDHFAGSGVGVEYDSVSNNGSWSGESEDHKEKVSNPPVRQEIIPGADNEKREKIRQKNERKHQRQKERRAQELHERCSGYLMSRKLEALAQQLVAMGFSHERATMALILNEGKVEESVSWLFEGGEDADKHKDPNVGGGNLKIDTSEELARIAYMELKYKCSKQEVERAVVVAEGDLDKAAESLSTLKLDPPSGPPKPEETDDPPTTSNGKLPAPVNQNVLRSQPKPSPPSLTIQQRRDDKDFNYTKTVVSAGVSSENVNRNMQPLKKIQPKWAKPQQPVVAMEKRWPNAASNTSVSYSIATPLQVSAPSTKTEARFVAVGNEYNNLQQPGTMRESIIVMQRPQSVNMKQVPSTSISSSPPGTAASWYPSNPIDIVRPNGLTPHVPRTTGLSPNNKSSNQMFHQLHYPPQQHFLPGISPGDSPVTNRGNSLWSRTNPLPTLAAASSLGLFSGLGSTVSSGASSPVDWSTSGSMSQLDYTSIDWSLDRGLSSAGPGGLWLGSGSFKNVTQMYDPNASGLGVKLAMRPTRGGNGEPITGLRDDGVANTETSAANSREWTSPFEGKDLLSLPRQFVSSPSL